MISGNFFVCSEHNNSSTAIGVFSSHNAFPSLPHTGHSNINSNISPPIITYYFFANKTNHCKTMTIDAISDLLKMILFITSVNV